MSDELPPLARQALRRMVREHGVEATQEALNAIVRDISRETARKYLGRATAGVVPRH